MYSGQDEKERNTRRRGRPQITFIVDPIEERGHERLRDIENLNCDTIKETIGYDDSPSSNRKALDFCARYALVQNQRVCGTCEKQLALVKDPVDSHHRVIWHCPGCKAKKMTMKVRVREGSFFEKMHLSIRKVLLLATVWVGNPGKKSKEVAAQIEVSKEAVEQMYDKYQDLEQQWCERCAIPKGQTLGGPGKIVELCVGHMSKRGTNHGTASPKTRTLAFGFIENGTEKIAVKEVESNTVPNLILVVNERIAPGSMIVTGDWKAFGGVAYVQSRHDQHAEKAGIEFVEPDDGRVRSAMGSSWERFRKEMESENLADTLFRRAHDQKVINHLLMEMKSYRRA